MKTFIFSILITALFAFNTQTTFAQYKPAKLQKQVQKLTAKKDVSTLFATSNVSIENIEIVETTDIGVAHYPLVDMTTVSFEVVVTFVAIGGKEQPNVQKYLCNLSKHRSLKWNRVSFEPLEGEKDNLEEIKELLTVE